MLHSSNAIDRCEMSAFNVVFLFRTLFRTIAKNSENATFIEFKNRKMNEKIDDFQL